MNYAIARFLFTLCYNGYPVSRSRKGRENREVCVNESVSKRPPRRRRRGGTAPKPGFRSTHKGRFGSVEISLTQEDSPKFQLQSPSGYFNALVETLCEALGLSVTLKATYDQDAGLQPLAHDLGFVLGDGFSKALPKETGETKTFQSFCMEEDSVARAILRPGSFTFRFRAETMTEDLFVKKDLPFQLIEEFLYHFCRAFGISAHLTLMEGHNAHRAGMALVGALAGCLSQMKKAENP